jgi:hypothetical protein
MCGLDRLTSKSRDSADWRISVPPGDFVFAMQGVFLRHPKRLVEPHQPQIRQLDPHGLGIPTVERGAKWRELECKVLEKMH